MAKFSKPLQFSETRSGLAALNQANQEAELKGLSKQIEKLGGSAVERSSLGRDGVERRDLGETIKATSQALNRLQTEQRYTDGYGKDWRDMRIGKENWTVPEYEKAVIEKYQSLIDRGHAIADKQYNAGELRTGLNKNQVIGQEMDDYARRGMRLWVKEMGIPEGGLAIYCKLIAVNITSMVVAIIRFQTSGLAVER